MTKAPRKPTSKAVRKPADPHPLASGESASPGAGEASNPEGAADAASASPEAGAGGSASVPAGPAGGKPAGKDHAWGDLGPLTALAEALREAFAADPVGTDAIVALARSMAQADVAPSPAGPVWRIVSKVEGFRRCGIAHPKAASDHLGERFGEAEILQLAGDPNLTVFAVNEDGEAVRVVIRDGRPTPEMPEAEAQAGATA